MIYFSDVRRYDLSEHSCSRLCTELWRFTMLCTFALLIPRALAFSGTERSGRSS